MRLAGNGGEDRSGAREGRRAPLGGSPAGSPARQKKEGPRKTEDGNLSTRPFHCRRE